MSPSPDSAILRRLREAPGAFTLPSLFGDPAEVNARIAALRDAGYEIEHHPHLGYRLVSSPDRIIADDILSRLPDSRWLRDILVFEKTASTNDLIATLARQGAPAGIVAFAERQTAGRGRLGRRWQSDPRLGLWFSLLLRPTLSVGQWPRLTLWLAYAIAHGIRDHIAPQASSPPQIMLKWPNDLYISGRKLAGILIESSPGDHGFAVAGIGLNVNHLEFPPPLDATATSLRIATGANTDRNALAACILASIDQSYSLIPNHFHQILAWAADADHLRDRWVSVTAGDTSIEGIAHGLDPDGALLIATQPGPVIRVTSGEVTRFSTLERFRSGLSQ